MDTSSFELKQNDKNSHVKSILQESLQFIPIVVMILCPVLFNTVFSLNPFIQTLVTILIIDMGTTLAVQEQAIKMNSNIKPLIDSVVVIWALILGTIFYVALEINKENNIMGCFLGLITLACMGIYYFKKFNYILSKGTVQ